MISSTTYELKEKLNNEEISFLQELVIERLKGTLPEKISNLKNELEYLEFKILEENIFSVSSHESFCEDFSFNNEIGTFDIQHNNKPYSFLINTFLLCIKSISPKKIIISKNGVQWEQYALMANQILKNTEYRFYDFEYVEMNSDVIVHIATTENLTAYKNDSNYSKNNDFEDEFKEYDEDDDFNIDYEKIKHF
jgi:hypothetical protein